MTVPVEISIIIPVHNHTDFLTRLLRSIRENAPGDGAYEVIVIDDASEDELAPIAQQYAVEYRRQETSRGPAAARNLGAQLAQAPILLFLDADLEYPRGLMERVLKEFKADPELAALSFVDIPYHPDDGIVKNYGAVIEHYFYRRAIGDSPLAPFEGLTTRNGAVRAEAFHAIGGFDERYTTNAFEDFDFGKRFAAEYPMAMAQDPLIYHNFPDKLRRLMRNYWVRTCLFVPYYLERRPKLDKAMTSGDEFMLRVIGFIATCALAGAAVLSPFAIGYAAVPAAFGLFLMLLYLFKIRQFLGNAYTYSGSIVFTICCIFIHWFSSIVIVCAGCWGLCRYLLGKLLPAKESACQQ